MGAKRRRLLGQDHTVHRRAHPPSAADTDGATDCAETPISALQSLVMQACDRCHRRKTKCDKVHPNCGPCVKGETSCVYSDKSKQLSYPKGLVERLERKNRQLQSANRALVEQLATQSSIDQRQFTGSTSPGEDDNAQAHGQGPGCDDIVNEVSFLSTSAGGDRQFLGSTSGLLFANIVRATVASAGPGGDGRTVPNPSRRQEHRPLAQARPEWSVDENSLPPLALAKLLIDAYLAHDHLCYPCLHQDFVREVFDGVYSDLSYYKSHDFEAFTFDMLLAIGTLQVHKFNWQALPDAETHHMRAMMRLDAVLRRGGLQALQAMLLLCQFRLSSSTKDTSGSMFYLFFNQSLVENS